MDKPKYNRIAAEMAERDVSNLDLAKGIGVTPNYISLLATNKQQPSWAVLYAIADYLHCDVRSLLVPNENSPKKDVKF